MKPKIQSILVYVELLLGGSRSSLVSHGQFANDNFATQHAFHVHFVGKPCTYYFFWAVVSIGGSVQAEFKKIGAPTFLDLFGLNFPMTRYFYL